MIIVRSPLRISLGGGGTDLPSYYEQYGGFLVAAAIDKYVYITLHHNFTAEFIVKYSRLERVKTVEEIEHPIVREALKLAGPEAAGLEITSMADIPAGTGLGSAQGVARASEEFGGSGPTGGTGLRDRVEPAARADRQAGPIHRGIRRHHLL
jgi:galactokinase/mevalonate kinase-like predicted kinase